MSQKIFDLFDKVTTDVSSDQIETASIVITMEILLNAIHDTPSSLLAVDMSIYEEWDEKI